MAETNNATEYSQKWWLTEIESAEKWLDKEWRKTADKVVNRYLDVRGDGDALYDNDGERRKYNVFWANVQIVKSALYATPPKPSVKREHDDSADDVARVAALILERILKSDLQPDNGGMHEAFQMSVDDRLIPGLGQVWLRYESHTEPTPAPDGGEPGLRVVHEEIHTEYVHWRDFIYPQIRIWDEKWWVGRRIWMKRKPFVAKFGQVKYDELKTNFEERGRTDPESPVGFKKGKIEIFEVWCEDTNKVYWINRHVDDILLEKTDLYGLDDFYPCPKPLLATHTTNKFIPRSDYTMAADQYEELDVLNDRISTLTKALRVVGVYDKNNPEIDKILSGSEMNMIPVDNWAAFAEQGGLKGQVDWFPVEIIANVLQQLMEQRVGVIQQIYELTSISDIQRGASNPRETLGAQKLKAQYSSVRLQLMQQAVGKFVRQAMKLKCEMVCKLWQPQTILDVSQVQQTESAQANPQLIPAAIQLLKDFKSNQYRIEVGEETLSLADYNAERELRTEYLTAVGQFVSQAGQVLEFAPGALPYILKLVQWVTASFRGSSDIESVLDEAIRTASQPQPQKDDGKQAENQLKMQIAQMQETGQNQRTQLVEENKLKVAEMNNGVKLLIEKMGALADQQSQIMDHHAQARTDDMQQAGERAQQVHDLLQTLITGHQSMQQQMDSQASTAQEAEAQRGHERQMAQDQITQQLKDLTSTMSKKRIRKPVFDDAGNITHVVDSMEQDNEPTRH